MDNDDFGPLTGVETKSENNDNEPSVQEKLQVLQKEKNEMESEFGQKRAMFMELFRQKEESLEQARAEVRAATRESEKLRQQVAQLQVEMDDIKTAAAISEGSKQDEVELIRRKCQEEIASLQHIMADAVQQAHQDAVAKYSSECNKLRQMNEVLENERQELRSKLSQEREGFLASVAKTLQKKVGNTLNTSSEAENLEDSMRKAQEDAEMLRSVVLPLEDELNMMKDKLKDSNDRCHQYMDKLRAVLGDAGDEFISTVSGPTVEISEKMKELNKHLETEKASRTDLEMYVAVLNTQKAVLQEDADSLRAELHEVCRLLELEKREHMELKRTWTMANDQFLESQRQMMMDMRRMQSVLTSEQQRQIAEQAKKDTEKEIQERQGREGKETQDASRRDSLGSAATDPMDMSLGPLDASKGSLTSITSEDLLKLDQAEGLSASAGSDSSLMKRSSSSSGLAKDGTGTGLGAASGGGGSGVGGEDTQSLSAMEDILHRASPERSSGAAVATLTEAQQKAITAPTPEAEASQSLLASAKAKVESFSMVGKRLVSNKEWELLQQEVKMAREKLGRPCDMCSNYESQLQVAQDNERKAQGQVRTLDRQLQNERAALANQAKYTEELEEMLKTVAEQAQKQISTLVTKVSESEKYVTSMKQQLISTQTELQDQLKTLTADREEIQKELTRLQEENDSLIGKHSKHSQQLQEENIDLPNSVEELQLLLLKSREELITAKVHTEHAEETLKSERLFFKDQVLAEQQEKATLEETLSQEISQLQEQLAIQQSMATEHEHQVKLRQESEVKLRETEQSLKNVQAKSKQLINALQNQVEEQGGTRTSLESEVSRLKAKVTSLQIDLDNSEAVQRDFVKLSQSLQIQLEKIRAAEHEVRWQHEEDIDECTYCKQAFSVTRRKHHCRHCGKIFCSDCLTKSVSGGPNNRLAKVCDVCHTILVQDATPFFSTEPPQTPD